MAAFHPVRLEETLASFIAMLEEVVARGMAAGEFLPGDARRTARFIYLLLSATLHAESLDVARAFVPAHARGWRRISGNSVAAPSRPDERTN